MIYIEIGWIGKGMVLGNNGPGKHGTSAKIGKNGTSEIAACSRVRL
jgi:hypothetical protein